MYNRRDVTEQLLPGKIEFVSQLQDALSQIAALHSVRLDDLAFRLHDSLNLNEAYLLLEMALSQEVHGAVSKVLPQLITVVNTLRSDRDPDGQIVLEKGVCLTLLTVALQRYELPNGYLRELFDTITSMTFEGTSLVGLQSLVAFVIGVGYYLMPNPFATTAERCAASIGIIASQLNSLTSAFQGIF